MTRDLRWLLAVILTLVVCFGGVVIFTPLHKHDRGKCSLNNLEGCQPDTVASAILLPTPERAGHFEASLIQASESVPALALLPARAPPAALL